VITACYKKNGERRYKMEKIVLLGFALFYLFASAGLAAEKEEK
jgi:hypothetical protein